MSGISTLGTTLDQMDRLKKLNSNLSLLSYQLATNKKTNMFSGLGNDVLVSKRARANLKSLEVHQTNIKLADNRIEQSLNALKEFKAQSENLRAFFVTFSKESPHQMGEYIRQDDPATPLVDEALAIGLSSGDMTTDFKTMVNFANNVFDFMVDLVNRQEDGRYLFAGADGKNKPLVDTSLLESTMSTAISNWKNETGANHIPTQDLIADLLDRNATGSNPDAFTDTVVGFNSMLSSGNAGKVNARIDNYTEVDYTSLGNNQGIRDILVAVTFLKNESLPPIADVYAEPYTYGDMPIQEGAPGATLDEQIKNFVSVFNEVTNMVNRGLQNLESEIVHLEMARVRLNEASKLNTQQINLAKNMVSDVEDVDLDEVAVKINSLKTSLEASYRVTALMQEMSLVNFI